MSFWNAKDKYLYQTFPRCLVRLSPIEFLNSLKCETNKAKLFRKLLDINDVYLKLLGDRRQHKLAAEYRWTVLLGYHFPQDFEYFSFFIGTLLIPRLHLGTWRDLARYQVLNLGTFNKKPFSNYRGEQAFCGPQPRSRLWTFLYHGPQIRNFLLYLNISSLSGNWKLKNIQI